MHPFDLTRLPAPAANKLRRLRQARDDALHLARSMSDRIYDLRQQADAAERRHRELKTGRVGILEFASDDFLIAPQPVSRVGEGLPDDDPLVVDAKRELDQKNSDLEHAIMIEEARQAAWQSAGQLLTRIEGYLAGLTGAIAGMGRERLGISLKKGEAIKDGIEARRRRIRALRADALQVRAAPIPSASAKKILHAQIEALAEFGTPDVLRTLEVGEPMSWPTQRLQFDVHASTGPAMVRGMAGGLVIDAPAILAWLFKDQLLKRLDAEIDELADGDKDALSDDQRAEQLAQIARDILAVEREEEELICQAEAQSMSINRRTDADPRAVLSLASSLPSPRE